MRRIAPGCDESRSHATYENRIFASLTELSVFPALAPTSAPLEAAQPNATNRDLLRRKVGVCDELILFARFTFNWPITPEEFPPIPDPSP
jgi:hypothetical protein